MDFIPPPKYEKTATEVMFEQQQKEIEDYIIGKHPIKLFSW